MHITFMKNPSPKNRFGRVLLAAAFGAGSFACVMFFTRLYIDSLGVEVGKPRWIHFFMPLQDIPLSSLSQLWHSMGFGVIQRGIQFDIFASIADGLSAFVVLLIPGLLWQLFKSYDQDRKSVAP